MRTLFICFISVTISCCLLISDASAKRFGGGRSFGVQRSHNSLFSSHKSQKTQAKMQPSNKSKWGGLLGGMLIGGLLTSLFMGHGLANGAVTWLILGSIIFFIVTMLRKKMNSGWQFANSSTFNSKSYNQFPQSSIFSNDNDAEFTDYPEGFNEDTFLRTVKVYFIRLQAAYDQKNLLDLQSFTTPEVYAEIKMQLEERGDDPNITEVIRLNASLLDVSKPDQSYVASVHFTGAVKDNNEAAAELDEVWHFYQSTNSAQWVVSGIQQAVH